MMEVLIKIKMPDNWVKDVGKEFSTPIKFIDCMPFGESGGRGLVEINNKEGLTDEIIKAIREHPDVCRVDISPLQNGGVLGSIVSNKCVACKALTGSDCFLVSAVSLEDGRVEWKLITGAEGSLVDLLQKLESYGCGVELKRKTRLSKRSLLTERQEQITQAALDKGYYNRPKDVTIKQLARLFDISPATLGEILQKGEKKIIQQHFIEKR